MSDGAMMDRPHTATPHAPGPHISWFHAPAPKTDRHG